MFTKFSTAVLLFFFCLSLQHSNAQSNCGSWQGDIILPNASLGVIFNISENKDGQLSAQMDVPQQGAANVPVGEIRVTQDSLFLNVPSIFGKYKGRIISTDSIVGEWSQGGNSFVLNLKKTGEVKKIRRPQTPKAPFPYLIEEVTYTNPQSGFKIGGTLTLPQDAKNCPAVILISGSGAQDRNETIHQQQPFWVIADYLTRNGIAVLRTDDRGVGASEGKTSDATSKDFATDVLCGVNFLKTRPQINPASIGLIGHSEGGVVAPLAAVSSKNVSFMVLLAGAGIPGDSLLIEQTGLILEKSGMPQERINAQLFLTKGIINILKKEKDAASRTESLRNAVTNGMYKNMDADNQKMVDGQLAQYDNNWFSFFVSYDPQPTLEKVKCPVLALNGGKDVQVPPKSNLQAIKKALKSGENVDFKCMELPGLNHLFQRCDTGLPKEYAQIEETISPEVLAIIKDWILKTTRQ